MSREVKVAIGVLVCIIGLIAYVELNKKTELQPVIEPIPEVAVVQQPVVPTPVVIEPPKPVEIEAPAPLVVDVVPPKEEVKITPPKPVAKPVEIKPKSETIVPNSKLASHYVVQKGDTLMSICEKELGSVKFQSALLDSNPELQPHRLYPGIELLLPNRASLQAIADRENSARSQMKDAYIVKKGDTLYGIAKKVLGSGDRVPEIISLNPQIDPRKLYVGAKLKMPKS